jgi:hypothetical protein
MLSFHLGPPISCGPFFRTPVPFLEVFLADHPSATARQTQVGDRQLKFHEDWDNLSDDRANRIARSGGVGANLPQPAPARGIRCAPCLLLWVELLR